MRTLFVLASVMVVLVLAAPNKIKAQKRSAAAPSAESIVNAYFRYRVTSESGGALSPTGFRKTNGYESGFGLYVMEWQAEVLFQQDGYKAGDMFVGYWQNFRVLNQKPGTLDSLIVGNTIFFNKGTTVRLTGTATFRKTEKGPRLEAFDVKTSQVLGRVAATPTKPISKPKIPAPALSNTKVTAQLESSWNYYRRIKIFLGPTYFGNSTSFGRWGDKPYALELMSDYPIYLALASKGVIKLDAMSLEGAPNRDIQSAATISVTETGTKLGTLDDKANTVTFVLGTYRVERITSNSVISTDNGNYRLVVGTHLLDIAPAFADIWSNLNWPTYRERRFRVLFVYEGDEWTRSDGTSGRDAPRWKVATASNGRFTAEDVGPRIGDFDSNNVPPTLDQLRAKRR